MISSPSDFTPFPTLIVAVASGYVKLTFVVSEAYDGATDDMAAMTARREYSIAVRIEFIGRSYGYMSAKDNSFRGFLITLPFRNSNKIMLRLQTPVTDERCKVGISYSDKIMMLGSCFSENIGVQLKNFGFDVCINPFGVLYNPVSVLNSVERMLDIRQFSLEDCIQIGAGDTRFCSFSHHTSFAREEA
jgi:hypothetical protein